VINEFPSLSEETETMATKFADVEVMGVNVQMLLETFGPFRSVASRILLAHGMGKRTPEGLAEFVPDAWYPLDSNLGALADIMKEGAAILYNAGLSIPKHFPLPPTIVDARSALQGTDVAYHMGHRYKRQPMFNPATGEMVDGGIGHYLCQLGPGKNQAMMICDNPYPCPLDKGIVTGFTRRFGKLVTVDHEPTQCRMRGDKSCTYVVSWQD
jgi:hypothetical protein